MNKINKKCFTLVEIVITIAVIAIIAAIAIPACADLINKANLSIDIQTVKQINAVLEMCDEGDIENAADVKIECLRNGIGKAIYQPKSDGYDFHYIKSENCVILVDKNMKTVEPEELKDKEFGLKDRLSLKGTGNQEAANILINGLPITGDLDLYGAEINIRPTSDLTIAADDSTLSNGMPTVSITNLSCDTFNPRYNRINSSDLKAGMIACVPQGITVTVKNVIIDGAVVGDVGRSYFESVGIIAGRVEGTLIVENVIIKDSFAFGCRDIGALVGTVANGGKVIAKNVTFENSEISGAEKVASVIGYVDITQGITLENIVKTNVKVVASGFNDNYIKGDGTVYDFDYFNTYTDFRGDEHLYDDGHYWAHCTDNDYWVRLYIKEADKFVTRDGKSVADIKSVGGSYNGIIEPPENEGSYSDDWY
ncbi:MAG: prepilin-type N-terminal cleavage/methylation domain-containing protein [Clostridia bacterium]|nr:prepilin-type N-terminal cleavage/methylation domain-containing protein [Clostridia bacterium]